MTRPPRPRCASSPRSASPRAKPARPRLRACARSPSRASSIWPAVTHSCWSPRGRPTRWLTNGSSALRVAVDALHRTVARPREVDPAFGALPDILGRDHRPRLVVQHRAARLGDVLGDLLAHEFERLAGVGHVVGDQHARTTNIDDVERGRQYDGYVEPRVDTRVELDVHRETVLDVERIRERAGDGQTTARDCEHDVGTKPVSDDLPGERSARQAETLPGEDLARLVHAFWFSARTVSAAGRARLSTPASSNRR